MFNNIFCLLKTHINEVELCRIIIKIIGNCPKIGNIWFDIDGNDYYIFDKSYKWSLVYT